MTLGQVKKTALALIEEYAPDNDLLTDDEDIQTRINLLVNSAYQELSQIKKINATHILDRTEKGNSKYYREYDMPEDLYQLKNIIVKDNETNEVLSANLDHYIENNKIFINDLTEGNYIINYFKYPEEINEETLDDFKLELDQDACNVLPYAVASDILKADISNDYSIFEAKYQSMLRRLDNRKDLSITIGKL